MSITTVFDPPLPSDSREVFNTKAFDTVAKLNSWSAQANQLATDINADVTNPGVVAVGADLIGSNTIGAVAAVAADVSAVAAIDADVSEVAAIAADVAALAAAIADIQAALADLPALSAKVSKTGDTMTGHLSVPAGATGNQVPRSSEVVHMTGAETIAGVKTFSSRPKVPAGATGTEVPQAQEIFGKGQSWQTVTRNSGMVYTNSTGKPFLFTVIGVATAEPAILYVEINGVYSYRDVGWIIGDAVVLTAVIPDGLTYKYVATDIDSITTMEYR